MPPYDISSTEHSVVEILHQHHNLHHTPTDPTRLAPEDAFYAQSPPRRPRPQSPLGLGSENINLRAVAETRRKRDIEKRAGRRRKGQWKKLLWVKQAYPDNYTDEETFLHDLKRNPSFQQYEFWPLMTDATVIVQHLCSVVVFICCFVGIKQDRISPVSVVGWGTIGTIIGWMLWDFWIGQEEDAKAKKYAVAFTERSNKEGLEGESTTSSASSNQAAVSPVSTEQLLIGSVSPGHGTSLMDSHSYHAPPTTPFTSSVLASNMSYSKGYSVGTDYGYHASLYGPTGPLSPRSSQRLATAKSAILIYCALLGLSPILKSLTRSTTSDSIWAMSCWLMCINIFFFDYGGAPGAKFPASLSTNAALMASTVLASRLPSTTHVFSLTLFSIEVFGLFPVFRRHLRHVSWICHLLLTVFLVIAAGAGVGATVSGGGVKAASIGIVLGGFLTFLCMGVCSWWLIGLQKYKNEIHGPWDPAKPIIRRRWDP